jgi:hypothetical protein
MAQAQDGLDADHAEQTFAKTICKTKAVSKADVPAPGE